MKKIKIPDNCEIIKDGDTYIVKEKKQGSPRSWKKFCKKNPLKIGEAFINTSSEIIVYELSSLRHEIRDTNVCTSKEEAEAFLALMQLRQLRKAWVKDWEPQMNTPYSIIYLDNNILNIGNNITINRSMSFPTEEMARDFLNCFKDLCETAKILL